MQPLGGPQPTAQPSVQPATQPPTEPATQSSAEPHDEADRWQAEEWWQQPSHEPEWKAEEGWQGGWQGGCEGSGRPWNFKKQRGGVARLHFAQKYGHGGWGWTQGHVPQYAKEDPRYDES